MDIYEIRKQNARALLRQVRDVQAEFVRITGIDQTYVSRIIGPNPERNIGSKLARRIETGFGKPTGWLDTLHGESATYVAQNGQASDSDNENVEPGPDVGQGVPLISWVAAGNWADIVDNFQPGQAEAWYPCPVSHGPATYCLRVKGASMEPVFPDGELIFVDPDRQPANGDYVVVRLEDRQEATFKKLRIEGGEMWLEALNPAWPERFIRVTEHATFCGVAIFRGSPL